MNRRVRSRQNDGRSAGARAMRGVASLRTAMNGLCLKRLSPDPSTIVASPWWSVTLSDHYGSDGGVSEGNLYNSLVEQCKVPSGAKVELRILSARAWELSGNVLGFYPGTLSTVSDKFIARLEDVAARNAWSKAGYIWPRSYQETVIQSSATTDKKVTICYLNTAKAQGTDIELHVDILFRFAGTVLPRARGLKTPLLSLSDCWPESQESQGEALIVGTC